MAATYTTVPRPRVTHRRRRFNEYAVTAVLFLLPAFAFLGVFVLAHHRLIPAQFLQMERRRPDLTFLGVDNWVRLAKRSSGAVRNNFIIVFLSLLVQLPIGLRSPRQTAAPQFSFFKVIISCRCSYPPSPSASSSRTSTTPTSASCHIWNASAWTLDQEWLSNLRSRLFRDRRHLLAIYPFTWSIPGLLSGIPLNCARRHTTGLPRTNTS